MSEENSIDLGSEGARVAAGFGGGLGRGEACGAFTGAVMALGAALGRTSAEIDPQPLKELRTRLLDQLDAVFGSIRCCDLRPEEDDNRPLCSGYVVRAAELTAKMLDKYR